MSELDDLFAEWADESLTIAEEQFEVGVEAWLAAVDTPDQAAD